MSLSKIGVRISAGVRKKINRKRQADLKKISEMAKNM
jgi:hypothetical protein